MKAITICQPYAHLIATGKKFVENRTWNTAQRGWLAIHAGLSHKMLDETHSDELIAEMSFGAVVAVAWLHTTVHIDTLDTMIANGDVPVWVREHEHTHGPWCWVFSEVYRLSEPFACSGHQGFFNLDAEEVVYMRAVCEPAHRAS